jgi:hypothetical protein
MLSVQRSMNVRGHRRSASKALSAAAAFNVVGLERRLLMCLDELGHDDGGLDELPSDLGTYPASRSSQSRGRQVVRLPRETCMGAGRTA